MAQYNAPGFLLCWMITVITVAILYYSKRILAVYNGYWWMWSQNNEASGHRFPRPTGIPNALIWRHLKNGQGWSSPRQFSTGKEELGGGVISQTSMDNDDGGDYDNKDYAAAAGESHFTVKMNYSFQAQIIFIWAPTATILRRGF